MKIRFSANYLPLSWVIKVWTLSKVSHVEFIFSDGTMIYPSVETGHVILTRRKKYPYIYEFDLDITDKQEAELRAWAQEQIGVSYDWTSLAPWNIFIKRKKSWWGDSAYWMCSEFCAKGLAHIGINLFDETFKKITPEHLFQRIKLLDRATYIEKD